MKIYIAHAKGFDFRRELYEPIKNNALSKEHTFVFPYEEGAPYFDSKEFFQNGCDLVIAEVSHPSTGLGIELGWADTLRIPIACIYKKDSKLSNSLKTVTSTSFEYASSDELVIQINKIIDQQNY